MSYWGNYTCSADPTALKDVMWRAMAKLHERNIKWSNRHALAAGTPYYVQPTLNPYCVDPNRFYLRVKRERIFWRLINTALTPIYVTINRFRCKRSAWTTGAGVNVVPWACWVVDTQTDATYRPDGTNTSYSTISFSDLRTIGSQLSKFPLHSPALGLVGHGALGTGYVHTADLGAFSPTDVWVRAGTQGTGAVRFNANYTLSDDHQTAYSVERENPGNTPYAGTAYFDWSRVPGYTDRKNFLLKRYFKIMYSRRLTIPVGMTARFVTRGRGFTVNPVRDNLLKNTVWQNSAADTNWDAATVFYLNYDGLDLEPKWWGREAPRATQIVSLNIRGPIVHDTDVTSQQGATAATYAPASMDVVTNYKMWYRVIQRPPFPRTRHNLEHYLSAETLASKLPIVWPTAIPAAAEAKIDQ